VDHLAHVADKPSAARVGEGIVPMILVDEHPSYHTPGIYPDFAVDTFVLDPPNHFSFAHDPLPEPAPFVARTHYL